MKKIVISSTLLILTVFILSMSFANNIADEIRRRERELEEIRQQLEKVSERMDENQALQSTTNQNINRTNQQIRALESEIQSLNNNITQTEKAILQKEKEIEVLEEIIEDKTELLNQRLRVMYKSGTVGYLEVLFGAEDLTDFLSRVDMLQKILTHDQNLITSLEESHYELEQQKLTLVETQEQLVRLFDSKLVAQNDLNASLRRLYAYKESLLKDEEALAEQEEQNLRLANEITEKLKQLELAPTYVGGEMMWPVPGHFTISSPFGHRIHPITMNPSTHTGIDIQAPMGASVLAAQTGTVIHSNWLGSYGKTIMIDHGGGYVTLYAHNSELAVKVGDVVRKGDQIALIGSTGFSTGPHLHFEVRINGEYVDPLPYVRGQ